MNTIKRFIGIIGLISLAFISLVVQYVEGDSYYTNDIAEFLAPIVVILYIATSTFALSSIIFDEKL